MAIEHVLDDMTKPGVKICRVIFVSNSLLLVLNDWMWKINELKSIMSIKEESMLFLRLLMRPDMLPGSIFE